MIVGLILPGILLIYMFFYGLASGETDHPLFIAGATLMVLLVVFVFVCFGIINSY